MIHQRFIAAPQTAAVAGVANVLIAEAPESLEADREKQISRSSPAPYSDYDDEKWSPRTRLVIILGIPCLLWALIWAAVGFF